MSEIRAVFEPGTWKDFSKEHAALRQVIEQALGDCTRGRTPDPVAVWGAYGAGKTQFLFWVAEKALEDGLIPVYFHLNDLLDGLPEDPSPDTLRKHACLFVAKVIEKLRGKDEDPWLVEVYRDKELLAYVKNHIKSDAKTAVLLVDEVEQAYLTLARRVRADDRGPLRAWLEEETFKVFAFAVGSLYVLGRVDRERLNVLPIPPVQPQAAKALFKDLPEKAVNGIWWLSRGKPRHLMKAVKKYRVCNPLSATEVYSFVSNLDSVSQAPYESESQNVVPAAYLDQMETDEVGLLLCLGPDKSGGEGKLIPVSAPTQDALLAILKDAFKLESVAYDLVRYIMLLAEAVAVDGQFALLEKDTPYLLRLAVDFLLEYERERLEQDTVEGNAALRKLLEVHDRANEKAGEVFWKLHGMVGDAQQAKPAISFEALASAFPLPTTSPTLFGTDPAAIRAKFEEQKQPVFGWVDHGGNNVFFLTSVASLYSYASSKQFREAALAPSTGVVVLLPYDSEEWRPTGLLDWLKTHERLRVVRLPLALTDFLLSLRAFSPEGQDPIAVAGQAEADKNLKRQVSFYKSRLESFTAEMGCRAYQLVPSPLPTVLKDLEIRVTDKDNLSLAICQAFESLTPVVLGYLADLRMMVQATKGIWDRKVPGYMSLATVALPHRSPKNDRPEAAKVIDDLRAVFSTCRDALSGLASHVDVDDMDTLAKDRAGEVALRALWQVKRGIPDDEVNDLNLAAHQLTDVLQVLKSVKGMETRLQTLGVTPSIGDLAILVESLTAIEVVATNANDLIKGRAAADKQLARALYGRFIKAFLANVESDAAKAKLAVSKLKDCLDEIGDAKKRLVEAAAAEPALFVEIDTKAMEELTAAIVQDGLQALGSTPPISEVLAHLEEISEALAGLETHMSDLSEAYEELRSVVMEKPDGG